MKGHAIKVLPIILGLLLVNHPARSVAQEPSSKGEGTLQWVTSAVHAPRLSYRTFDSTAAKSKVSYHIYTPELYDTQKERRFPVLYWFHGHGGRLAGIPRLVKHFHNAIRAGKMPAAIIVFPNGMAESMWCDSKDGKVQMETVVVKELVPHVDATYRTIASRKGRLIEGFSMGGYGAARLAFKYHDIFGAASMLGAGPLQQEFIPSVGPKHKARDRVRILKTVYGGDQEYFITQSPWVLAELNAAAVRGTTRVRQVVGERDKTLDFNRSFDAHLTRIGIPHTFSVLPDIAHDTMTLFNALGEDNWEFYYAVFGNASCSDDRDKKERRPTK